MKKLIVTEEETMLADSAAGFLQTAAPVSKFREMRDAGQTHDAALWGQMVEQGWAGVLVPEEAGGSDMGFAAANVLAHEMGKTLTISPFLSSAVIAATALRQVSDARATAALSEIASGEATYALAIDEGSHPANCSDPPTRSHPGRAWRRSQKQPQEIAPVYPFPNFNSPTPNGSQSATFRYG